MKLLTLKIYEKGKHYRKGKLFFEGRLLMLTLEDEDRGLDHSMGINKIMSIKESGNTAIPYGLYPIEVRYSKKSCYPVPWLTGVKGFFDIQIHTGNSSKDTKGCILVGMIDKPNEDWISYSLTALRILKDVLNNEPDKDVWIQIIDTTLKS